MLGDQAVIVTLILLTAWWAIGRSLLLSWYKSSADSVLALPIGLAVSGLLTLILWLGGVPVSHGASLTWLLAIVALVYLFIHFRPERKIPKFNLAWIERLVKQKYSAAIVSSGIIVIFSLSIIMVWQSAVQPVTWDNLTLYDFRAHRLAEGWLPSHFMSQFPGSRAYGMYDFLHPFFASILGAIVYASGGQNVPIVYAALLLTVLSHGVKVFRTSFARLVFGSLLLGTPLFFQNAVESYAVWLAILFWSHLIFFWLVKRSGSRADLVITSFLLAAAAQSRLSEPYWLFFLVWLGWRKWLAWLVPLLSFFPWQIAVKQAARQTITGVVRSSYTPGQFLPKVLTGLNVSTFLEVLKTLILANPMLPYLGLLILTLSGGWSSLSVGDRKQARSWLGLLFLWGAMLLAGMLGLYLWNPAAWPESSLALSRAGLPLVVLAITLTAWLVDRLPIDPDLVS